MCITKQCNPILQSILYYLWGWGRFRGWQQLGTVSLFGKERERSTYFSDRVKTQHLLHEVP